jgi:hypothetical protein
VGLTFGPSARTGLSDSTGVDAAIAGEIPLHDGLRGRAEIGSASSFRMNVTGTPATGPQHGGLMAHGAALVSVKRVF